MSRKKKKVIIKECVGEVYKDEWKTKTKKVLTDYILLFAGTRSTVSDCYFTEMHLDLWLIYGKILFTSITDRIGIYILHYLVFEKFFQGFCCGFSNWHLEIELVEKIYYRARHLNY